MLLTVNAVCVQPARAADNGTYPPDSKPFGLSYGEWSAKWWQWVYSTKLEQNPQLQGIPPSFPADKVDCSLGQSGPVWFLGADFGGTAARECKDTVPTDVSLFFPVVNTYFGVIGFDCIHQGSFAHVTYPFSPVNDCLANPWPSFDLGIAPADQPNVHNWDDLVKLVANELTTVFEADVDGVPIIAYRAQAPTFSVTTPSQNVLGYTWPGVPGQRGLGKPGERGLGKCGTCVADTYYPNGSDGYWLMLKPLTLGHHTVHFSGGGFLDVTYGFTVAPDKKQ
jgi:hypothetical protein